MAAGVHCGECEFCRAGEFIMCVDYHILGEHTPGVHVEFPVVPAGNLVPVPEDVAWETAAAAPLVFGTARRMLVTRGELDDVLDLVWTGALDPHVRATLPMSETTAGHRMIKERDGFGKVVLVPGRQYE